MEVVAQPEMRTLVPSSERDFAPGKTGPRSVGVTHARAYLELKDTLGHNSWTDAW